jgi:hypothetical protein
MVQYFFLKGHGSKLIHKELVSRLQGNAILPSTVKNWLRGFESGALSCGDPERPERPLISIGPALQRFLKKPPFLTARVMSGNFSVDRGLGLRKFTLRWVPHILSAEQKLTRVAESQSLVAIRANFAEKNFQGTIPGDESWFTSLTEYDAMFTFSPAEVTPRAGHEFRTNKLSLRLFSRQTAD